MNEESDNDSIPSYRKPVNARPALRDVENPVEYNASDEETDEDLAIYVKKKKEKERFQTDDEESTEEGKCCTWCCCWCCGLCGKRRVPSRRTSSVAPEKVIVTSDEGE